MRETAVTWRRDLKSITRFYLLSSLKDAGLLCPFSHKSSKPDELVAHINSGLCKAVDDVAPSLVACNSLSGESHVPNNTKLVTIRSSFLKNLKNCVVKSVSLNDVSEKLALLVTRVFLNLSSTNMSQHCERASPHSSIRS